MSTLLIYGATGYTGRMAAEHAKALGLNFEIGGRSHSPLATLAAHLDVPFRVFDAGPDAENALSGITVLLNFAGPFAQTAEALMPVLPRHWVRRAQQSSSTMPRVRATPMRWLLTLRSVAAQPSPYRLI